MNENMTGRSCEEFCEMLSAKTPTPGGGGASALAGALGASLGAMVSNYTLGKKKYAGVQEDMQTLLEQAEELRRDLLKQVEADAAAFEPLSRAYAIPKDDPTRGEVMERCLRDAAAAPMEILRLACRGIELHQELEQKGSATVASDVGTGVILCWAALYGAWLNVKVNTRLMADRTCAGAMNAEADALVNRYWKTAEAVYEAVMGRYA